MKELQILTNALDMAVKAGVFNLQDTGSILQAINVVGNKLQRAESQSNSITETPISDHSEEKSLPKKIVKKA